MKLSRWAIALFGCAVVSPLWGQTVEQPNSVSPQFKYSYYATEREPAPSEVAADIIPEAPSVNSVIGSGTAAPIADYSMGCDTGCGNAVSCCSTEPYRLFPQIGGLSIDGWAAVGGTYNADKPGDKYNGVNTFNDRTEIQLNQLYLRVGKKLDNCCGFDWGGQVDVMFGSDYIYTQATGLETRRNGNPKWNAHEQYGLALPQMYAEFGVGALTAKVGHFYTIIGNEVVTAPDNFFYSHSYTMQYGEPFTHTGVLANYAWSDRVNLQAGVHNGWDNFDATTERAGFLGGMNWASCDQRSTLAVSITTGDELNNMANYSNRTMISIVGSRQVTDNLQYVIQHDNGWQKDFFGAGADAEWYGINQYLLYTINDCWKAGARFEWFRDDDGSRVSGVRPSNPNNGPFTGNFYEFSAGLNWTPADNIIFRPEVRWDWFNGTGLPYDGGTKDEQFTGAFDAIFLF